MSVFGGVLKERDPNNPFTGYKNQFVATTIAHESRVKDLKSSIVDTQSRTTKVFSKVNKAMMKMHEDEDPFFKGRRFRVKGIQGVDAEAFKAEWDFVKDSNKTDALERAIERKKRLEEFRKHQANLEKKKTAIKLFSKIKLF